MKKQTKAQRKGKLQPITSVKGNNGLKRRRQKRRAQQPPSTEGLRVYDPEELLSPPKLLSRFAERAQELIADLPQGEQPAQATVSSALRQAVLEAFRSRDDYLARMVETDLVANTPNQNAAVVQRSIRAALISLGVRCVDTPEEREHFVVVEGEGETFKVLRPAYVDQATGKLVLAGQLRRVRVSGAAARTAAGRKAEEEERA